MKSLTIVLIVLSIALLSACASPSAPATPASAAQNTAGSAGSSASSLVVSDGIANKSYTRADLESLASSQSSFKGVTYKGVAIPALLKDAGIDPATAKAVKATASDGFSAKYDPAQVLADGVILAYATAGGDLAKGDGAFRMVLPNAEGKLNVRQLVKLQVVK
jgi:hypothetical protein